MEMEIGKIIVVFFVLIGAFLSMVASFGIIRLPDLYTRNHAAAKSATLGIMSLMIAAFIYFYIEHGHFNSRVLLGVFFVFFTSPVSGHLIARAAYNSGVKLWDKSVRDDLKKSRKGISK